MMHCSVCGHPFMKGGLCLHRVLNLYETLKGAIEKETSNAFGISTATRAKNPTIFTLSDFDALFKLVRSTLYYQLSQHIGKGNIYLIRERKTREGFLAPHPEYIIVHCEDLETVRAMITWRTLVPLSEHENGSR